MTVRPTRDDREALTVCVVLEKRRDGEGCQYLFGVYVDEIAARKGYGDEDEKYVPTFLTLKVYP